MGFVDLHRHLDGSLRFSTLQELAQQQNITIPKYEEIIFTPHMGLEDALQRFTYTLSLLQHPDSVRRVAKEMCDDAKKNNVTHLEIRFAPQLHKGVHIEEIVDAALDGINGQAGLLLCGLYGESPSMLDTLVDLAISRVGIVGIDLAGGPLPIHRYTMLDYKEAFQKAKKHGIGRTIHAGEGRPPSEIAMAILELGAQRIGHGTTLLEDKDVLELVISQNVCIEACVTSNLHTGVIASFEEHPIVEWLKHGVRVSICTDNTLLSQVNAPQEYARVSSLPQMTNEYIEQCIDFGCSALFR